jgi:hypothetical protein
MSDQTIPLLDLNFKLEGVEQAGAESNETCKATYFIEIH